MHPTRLRKSVPHDPASLRKLGDLRLSLLKLHKRLIDSERISYEAAIGTIPSPQHFLQLLTTDPWFAWLRPLSQLIIAIDEAEDGKEPVTSVVLEILCTRTAALLVASEVGEGFSRQYFEVLQRDPDVVLAHGETVRHLPSKPPGSTG